METRPSALCCRICVPLFIRIRTIRKSGYFARVLELRPVSRCHESSPRSCCSSRSKSISSRGSASPGSRCNTLMPWPGWHVLRFVDIMNTFLDTHVLITLRTTQTRTGLYISVRVVDRDYLGAPGRQMAFFSTAKSRHLTPKLVVPFFRNCAARSLFPARCPCARLLRENNHFPFHSQIIMKSANVWKYSRMRKCHAKARNCQRWCRKEQFVLRRCHNQPGMNITSAGIHYTMQSSVWIKDCIDRRNRVG